MRRSARNLEKYLLVKEKEEENHSTSSESESSYDDPEGSETATKGTMSDEDKTNNNVRINVYHGNNFPLWKKQLEIFLTLKKLWATVSTKPPVDRKEEWVDKNNLAMHIILSNLSKSYMGMIQRMTSAYEMWNAIVINYGATGDEAKLALEGEYQNARIRRNESALEFAQRLFELRAAAKELGAELTERDMITKLVNCLELRYEMLVICITGEPESTKTYAKLMARIKQYSVMFPDKERIVDRKFERRLKSNNGYQRTNWRLQEATALNAERSYHKNSNLKRSFSAQRKGSESRPKKDLSQIECYKCHKKGHYKSDCPNEKKARERSAMVAEAYLSESVIDDAWLIDSGATDHMINTMNNIQNYTQFDKPMPVRIGDARLLASYGKGTVSLEVTIDGKKRVLDLKDTLYVPDLKRKLISVSKGVDNGMSVNFEGQKVVVFDTTKTKVLEGTKCGKLFKVHCREFLEGDKEAQLNEVEEPNEESNLNLWHCRLAHQSKSNIIKMKNSDVVTGLENLDIVKESKQSDLDKIDCEACCFAKQTKTAVPRSHKERVTEVGMNVHVDICGPIGALSYNKKSYFILFKDEYSTYRHIYFMKSREEAYNLIRKYVAEVKADTNKNVLRFTSDRGSEFTSNRTQQFFLENQIAHAMSAPFTPQQNGIIERDNRTVMEATRAMLFYASMPEKLWNEAAATAVHVLNRSINTTSNNITPYELYFDKKPRLSHLRIFGCAAFMKAQEKKRSGYQKKLEARSTKLRLVGYERDYTYRLYNPASNKIEISRGVLFNEKDINKGNIQTYKYIDDFITNEDDSQQNEATLGEDHEVMVTESKPDLEPRNYEEAINSPQASDWKKAMQEEIDSLYKNKTWSIISYEPGKVKPIKCKWVYKLKRDSNNEIVRYKARLVAKGYSQVAGIDYEETFSPVVRLESVRLILSIVAKHDLDMKQFDVKTAFLNGKLEETILMEEPEEFKTDTTNGTIKVCKLEKSLYGLKQASRVWNNTFVDFLKRFKLEQLYSDSCVLIRKEPDMLIIAIYVDDGLVCSNNPHLLDEAIAHLKKEFEITELDAKCFVGLEIQRDRLNKSLSINQQSYIERLVSRFEMNNSKTVDIPMSSANKFIKDGVYGGGISKSVQVPFREAVGSLMYLMTASRPDIACSLNILARFCADPKLAHWIALKNIIRYVNSTKNCGITFCKSGESNLVAYCDSDYGGCCDTRRSVTGLVVKNYSGPIVWKSTKQSVTAESTVEAEFLACDAVSKEVVWVKNFLEEITPNKVESPIAINCDNQGTFELIKNKQIHSRIKHMDIKYMAVRERIDNKKIILKYVPTSDNQADIFTKPLPAKQFTKLKSLLSIGIVISMLLMTIAADCRIIFNKEDKVKGITHHLKLYFYDACSDFKKELTRHTLDANVIHQNGYSSLNYELCHEMVNKTLFSALEDLNNCLPSAERSSRNRRNPIAIISSINSVAAAIIGVSNFIRGLSRSTTTESQENAVTSLKEAVQSITSATINDNHLKREEVSKQLQIVSHVDGDSMQAMNDAASTMPTLYWMANHVHYELRSALANIKTITKLCKQEQLATKQVADLFDLEDLSILEPQETKLLGISYQDNHIDVSYKINYPIIVNFDAIEYAAIGISVALLIFILKYYWWKLYGKITRQNKQRTSLDAKKVS